MKKQSPTKQKFYCKYCNKSWTIKDKRDNHQLKQLCKPKEERLYCVVCFLSCETKKEYDIHLLSKVHINNLTNINNNKSYAFNSKNNTGNELKINITKKNTLFELDPFLSSGDVDILNNNSDIDIRINYQDGKNIKTNLNKFNKNDTIRNKTMILDNKKLLDDKNNFNKINKDSSNILSNNFVDEKYLNIEKLKTDGISDNNGNINMNNLTSDNINEYIDYDKFKEELKKGKLTNENMRILDKNKEIKKELIKQTFKDILFGEQIQQQALANEYTRKNQEYENINYSEIIKKDLSENEGPTNRQKKILGYLIHYQHEPALEMIKKMKLILTKIELVDADYLTSYIRNCSQLETKSKQIYCSYIDSFINTLINILEQGQETYNGMDIYDFVSKLTK